jgi:aminopeptidase N
VHDFAWTAWSSFREQTAEAEGVRIRVLYPPGYDGVAEREIAAAAFGLKYFGQQYGRYPYPVLTIVHPPQGATEAGGMEYPTLITTGGPWYSPPFVHDIEAVTLHELGHQYFYGLVATDEQS